MIKTEFSTENGARIRCLVRERYVQFTPEEEVRQRILFYLHEQLEYPYGRMMVEVKVTVNTMPKRADIVITGMHGEPRLVIECKRPSEKLSVHTFSQVAMYNHVLKAPYLLISNGVEHFMFSIQDDVQQMKALDAIPHYTDICK